MYPAQLLEPIVRQRRPQAAGLSPHRLGDLDRSGVSLDAAVRVEDALPDRLLRTELPVGGSQQCVAPAFPVHGVLPGRKRHVSPSIATFPHCEANQFHPAERACFGFEDHLRISKLPCGICLARSE